MAEHLEAQRRACGITWWLLALFHYLCSISLWKSQKPESFHKSNSPFKNLWATFPKLQQSHLLRSEASLCIFHILQLQPQDGGMLFLQLKRRHYLSFPQVVVTWNGRTFMIMCSVLLKHRLWLFYSLELCVCSAGEVKWFVLPGVNHLWQMCLVDTWVLHCTLAGEAQ